MAPGGGGALPAVMARDVPGPAAIPTAAMASAEVAAAEVVRRVQPTEASERRRAEVVDYARRIVGTALGCEVRALSPLRFAKRSPAAPPCFLSSVSSFVWVILGILVLVTLFFVWICLVCFRRFLSSGLVLVLHFKGIGSRVGLLFLD